MKYPYTVRLAVFESEDGKCHLLIEEKDSKFTKWARASKWIDVTFEEIPHDAGVAAKLAGIAVEEKRVEEEIHRQMKILAGLRDRKNALLPPRVDNFVDMGEETCSNGESGVRAAATPKT